MTERKINDCIAILNQLLIPGGELSKTDRQELLRFFVEEKITSVTVYGATIYERADENLHRIKDEKLKRVAENQYEAVARIRDVENDYLLCVERFHELKSKNMGAAFMYGTSGLCLYVLDGDYKHAICELEKWGLRVVYFNHSLFNA